jgi:hypothetical protein
MKMISHQAPGLRLPAGFSAGFRQGLEKILAVHFHFIQENTLAPMARLITW